MSLLTRIRDDPLLAYFLGLVLGAITNAVFRQEFKLDSAEREEALEAQLVALQTAHRMMSDAWEAHRTMAEASWVEHNHPEPPT